MGEWAFSPYNTISSTHGETRNAYDLSRIPAGSSGGTASPIAANFAMIGMCSDTGNPIRGSAPHSGQPAITVPMGYADNHLPLGLQILGRPFNEDKLFQYAYAYEQATRHRKPPLLFR